MDSTSLSLRVFFIMALLGIVCSSKTDKDCECPPIPKFPKTVPTKPGCYQINNTFRYTCIDGYKREAGTSNMIRCSKDNWSTPSLNCIQDPLNPGPPQTTATENIHTSTTSVTEPPSVHSTSSVSTEHTNTTVPPLQPTSASFIKPPSVHSTSSVSTEAEHTEMNTTLLPPRPTSASFIKSPSVHSTSSVSTEAEHTETNTTVLPPRPTSADPLSTTTPLPQTITHSTDPLSTTTPLPQTITHSTDTSRTTTSSTTSSTPVTPHSSHSTSTPQVHTKGDSRGNQTMSPYSTPSTHKGNVVPKMMSGVAVAVIALLAVGVAYLFYRRRSQNIPHGTPEEIIAMKPTPSD